MKLRDVGTDLVFAAVLGVLAIAAFVAQAMTIAPGANPLAVVLFNVLQFTLTTGSAWFSSRAVSRAEFAESMKRFAASAYRRVADIEVMVEKLQRRIGAMRAKRAAEDCADLDLIAAVVEDASQVVRSSISDWADVIGEELLALEQIKMLEREKRTFDHRRGTPGETSEIGQRVAELDKQIAALASMLPVNLQLEARREDQTAAPNEFATDWMAEMHQKQEGLRLEVVSGGQYTSTRNPKLLESSEALFTFRAADEGIDIVDAAGYPIGRVLNNSPLDYDDFRDALFNCYGTQRIPVAFDEVTAEQTETENRPAQVWYQVRVVVEPRPRDPGEFISPAKRLTS